MGTLWNAYTSYESSSSFSRTQFCEHFKDPTINTLKSKAKFICQTVGVRNLWEQVLGKETFEVKQCLPHQQCNTVRFPSRRPSQVGDLCFLLFSNFTTFKTKACGKWNCALVWSCHHLAGHFGALKLSHADYTQVNCFVPIQLVKNKSMIAVTGVERFHCEEENTYEGAML